MRTMVRAGVALTLMVVMAGLPASASEDCRTLPDELELCRQAAWFTAGDVPVGNLAPLLGDHHATWDTSPPSDEVGAVALSSGIVSLYDEFNEPFTAAHFVGSFTGDLDALLVTLHLTDHLPPGCAFFSCTPPNGGTGVQATLWVDDALLVQASKVVAYEDRDVNQTVSFALDGLHERSLTKGLARGPGVERTLRLVLETASANIDTVVAYRYGAADAPSGLVFNPVEEELDGVTVLTPRG